MTEDTPSLISTFFYLTKTLLRRTFISRQPSDLERCMAYLHYLWVLPLKAFGVKHDKVTAWLMRALVLQVRLGSVDIMTNIKEMIALCQELLTLDDLERHSTAAIRAFANLLYTHHTFEMLRLPLDELIQCLRVANTRIHDSYDVSMALSVCLLIRFNATRSTDDYNDAITTLDRIIATHSSADDLGRRERASDAAFVAALFARNRYIYFGRPDHLEEAIFRQRASLTTLALEDPHRHTSVGNLTALERIRFQDFGVVNPDAERRSRDPEVVDHPSFSNLAASLVNSNHIDILGADRDQHHKAMWSIPYEIDEADVEEAIAYSRLLLASLDPADELAHRTAFVFGHLSYRAAECTNDTEHLNKSITTFRDLLNMPSAHRMHFDAIRGLTLALFLRVRLLKETKDADEMMQLFAVAVSNPYAKVPARFSCAFAWARAARLLAHPSITAACENAFSLMQDSLAFAPTLEIQHFRLVAMRDAYEQLPLNYASHLVHIGQIEQAVETLEGGRGLLFSEMRGLRTSLDQLRAIDSALAEKFADINRDLETLTTTTVSPEAWLNNGGAEAQDTMEPFGHFVIKQRKLTDERDGIISHIRTLPGFEAFLMDPSFDTLRSAAARGPVIIINHSEWRSDIIILLYNSPPSLIPTADDFYERAKGLRDKLSVARKQGLDSGAYQEALSAVLEGLYDLVGRPVIQRLHELNVPEQSRIWWCPTSVFCTLPLHAMGPIPSDIGPPRYFLDLYIPSYAPSLSALIESRKPGSRTIVKPSLLLVLQPDASMVQGLEEMEAVQAIVPWATTLVGGTVTPTVVLERFRDHRFAHIVCHGILEPGKPFDSSFKLYDGKRLSLLDIVRSQLSNAVFAFLAACHTAELTDESPSDEALHLAAAMQYCGFRSVVGTMWAMADTDGRDLAGSFYKSLFSGRNQGEHYFERTAGALRDAVVKLRRTRGRGMTLERWVNYVHYGA